MKIDERTAMWSPGELSSGQFWPSFSHYVNTLIRLPSALKGAVLRGGELVRNAERDFGPAGQSGDDEPSRMRCFPLSDARGAYHCDHS